MRNAQRLLIDVQRTFCLVQGRNDELQIIVLIDINQFQLDSVLNNNVMLLRYYNKTNTLLDMNTYDVDRILYSCRISDCYSHANDCYLQTTLTLM